MLDVRSFFIQWVFQDLEFGKLLLLSWWFCVLDHIESDSLRKWSAFANSDNVAKFNIQESWWHMDGHVLKNIFIRMYVLLNILVTKDPRERSWRAFPIGK